MISLLLRQWIPHAFMISLLLHQWIHHAFMISFLLLQWISLWRLPTHTAIIVAVAVGYVSSTLVYVLCVVLMLIHISISTLPSYIYSTIPFARQVTCNTHTHTRNC